MAEASTALGGQEDLFEVEKTRALLDTLLADSRLYQTSKGYKELLDFVVRLRNFAPFNAMLLQVQKPGLTYADRHWMVRWRAVRWPRLPCGDVGARSNYHAYSVLQYR